MRTLNDIKKMSADDYKCGIPAHYKPLAELVKGMDAGLEIGTAYGNNALYLANHAELKSLTCIDPYIFYPAMPGFICQEEYDTLYEYARNRLSLVGVKLIRLTGKEYLETRAWRKVDFVFVDANHDYESVKYDIENFWLVVKEGGILCGHDYNIFEGVNKAVDEFALSIGKTVEVLDGNIWIINK